MEIDGNILYKEYSNPAPESEIGLLLRVIEDIRKREAAGRPRPAPASTDEHE